MRSYRRSPDRGNKLIVPKGLGPQSEGAAGPVRHLTANEAGIEQTPPIDPRYLAYRKWCRANRMEAKSIEKWSQRQRNKTR